jgi:SAM-dependent methyltransferase
MELLLLLCRECKVGLVLCKDSSARTAVARYYGGRVRKFGATPWGVDWTCEPTQSLRFVQLLKIAGRSRKYSLNDLGCGYGALLGFLRQRGNASIDYAGCDISRAMIRNARALWPSEPAATFIVSQSMPRVAHYSVASGVFNVQLGFGPRVWRTWIESVLHELNRSSERGFAVNFMLPPAPGLEPLAGLYRTTPLPWVDHCRRVFDAEVEVLGDYGLREFTLLVTKPIASRARRSA